MLILYVIDASETGTTLEMVANDCGAFDWRKPWIVVNCQANREFVAAHNLKSQGYEIYAPAIRKQTRHARRTRDVLAPLFPGYLFVRWLAPDMRWRPLLSTVGVRSIIRKGDVPSALDDAIVGALKFREVDGVITKSAEPREVGQIVRLARGPFDGIAAEIIELCDKDRLVVLITLLNRPIRTTVFESQLEAC